MEIQLKAIKPEKHDDVAKQMRSPDQSDRLDKLSARLLITRYSVRLKQLARWSCSPIITMVSPCAIVKDSCQYAEATNFHTDCFNVCDRG